MPNFSRKVVSLPDRSNELLKLIEKAQNIAKQNPMLAIAELERIRDSEDIELIVSQFVYRILCTNINLLQLHYSQNKTQLC
jgi:hypothetical protein